MVVVFCSMFVAASLVAQGDAQEEASQKYKERYTGDLFRDADVNNDGFVTLEEARAVSREVERDPLGKKRFNTADINNDGRLSPEEARKYRGLEVREREKASKRAKEFRNEEGETRDAATQTEPQINREKKRAAMKGQQHQTRQEEVQERRNRRVRPDRRQND